MPPRLILFGAFDRHNFGDLLLGHCALAARPGRDTVFTGLASRDLRAFDGHRVRALAEVVADFQGEAADFVHVGGELLTTTAWEAAVMLQSPEAARAALAAYDRQPIAREAWARRVLDCPRRLPYLVSAGALPPRWRVHFDAVGGSGFAGLAAELQAEALAALRGAATFSVRDRVTRDALAAAGLDARLVPDPAQRTRERFGQLIEARTAAGELAALRARMPDWIAVQIAAAWGDDATLARLAQAVVGLARDRGTGVVLFRAGLAPWHDDGEVLDRLAAQIAVAAPALPLARLASVAVFDICGLLAQARGYLGTSLHGWIVARSFGVPARCLVEGAGAKAACYIDTWNPDVVPGWVTLDGLERGEGTFDEA
ncbi:polysaccharide pyruvyl transferase family protein [Thauera phenolivorans]|uniref:polysaccharide pyruvyl transferase family protein n=1 Tax=Thauera phenolivorans TaxID=1792543 RepID=UPI00083A528F|nr:polysaccharide pyruvyl transferase family protein [Thauera phenolivorans]